MSGQLGLPLRHPDLAAPVMEPIRADVVDSVALSALDLLNSYAHVFVAAFLVTLLATPLVRRAAIAAGVIDHPDERKMHAYPVAYLGGMAVFLGLCMAILISYVTADEYTDAYLHVPFAIIIGMVAITFTGLADDVWGWDPRLKIAGQLVAAAALAINDIGVRVAEGLLTPFMGGPDVVLLTILDFHILNDHLFYWSGTALIAIFVLGGCNAANLLDGLDGLLSGTVAIVAIGLLAIGLLIAPFDFRGGEEARHEADRIVENLQERSDRYLETLGAPAPDLATLIRANPEDNLVRVPAMPLGWTLGYEPIAGTVHATDESTIIARAQSKRLHDMVRLYRDRYGAYPLTLDELVGDDLAVLPKLPAGRYLRYNPNTGWVDIDGDEPSLAGARIVLCLALLGAVLGFLPHNFNPATIFLGDCGSLLLGYMCIVIILMLGARGETYYVFAGLIVFAVPGIDTTLAIIRRRLAGTSLSAADNQHLHHQLKRALGGVKRAVFALYGISIAFAAVGISLVVLVMNGLRVRFVYAIALVLFGFIAVIAVKAGRRQKLLADMAATAKPNGRGGSRRSGPSKRGRKTAKALEEP